MQSVAAHRESHHVLCVVEHEQDYGYDDGPQELIARGVANIHVELAGEAGVAPHVDVVEAVEHHEVDGQGDEEDDEVGDGALVDTLRRIDTFLDAVPLRLRFRRPEACKLAQPVGENRCVEDGADELCEGKGQERGSVHVPGVPRVVEHEKEERD